MFPQDRSESQQHDSQAKNRPGPLSPIEAAEHPNYQDSQAKGRAPRPTKGEGGEGGRKSNTIVAPNREWRPIGRAVTS